MSTAINSAHDVQVEFDVNVSAASLPESFCKAKWFDEMMRLYLLDLATFKVLFAWWAMQSSVVTWVDTSNLAWTSCACVSFLFDPFICWNRGFKELTRNADDADDADAICGKHHTARVLKKTTSKLSWWWAGCDYCSFQSQCRKHSMKHRAVGIFSAVNWGFLPDCQS